MSMFVDNFDTEKALLFLRQMTSFLNGCEKEAIESAYS